MIIGLTGNIGSGKSTVAKFLKEQGAKVIDTDQVARAIVEPGKPALRKIAENFGSDVLNNDGSLDRQALAKIVFNDPAARRKLNAIMHPLITREIKKEILCYKKNRGHNAPALVIEVPLLFETGMEGLMDEIWLVTVDKPVQIQRIMNRDHVSEEHARQRIASQMPQREKIKKSHKTINNSKSLEHTYQQIVTLWKKVMQNTD